MLANYIKIARRSLWRNKAFSTINILGLAIGMAACFFVFQYVYLELSYDRFNKNAPQIYRVPISYSGSMADVPTTAANHPALGPAMKADFPEVVDFVRFVGVSLFMNASTMSYLDKAGREKTFNEDKIFIADDSFFRIFSYPLQYGDRNTCLTDANSVVISSSIAKKYFGSTNPVGETLKMNGEMPMKVTGVFDDVPDNSHIKFDMLLSFSTVGPKWGYDVWNWPEFYNYVVLAPGTDVKKLEAKFPAFINKYLSAKMKELNFGCAIHLQPLVDIHLKSNYIREAEANGSQKEIYFLSLIGAFILFIAWINYVNLSTAKSMERAKEVGLRKVVGAIKKQLVFQFLLEAMIINLMALSIAVAMIVAFLPLFNQFIGKDISTGFFTTGLGHEPSFWLLVSGVFFFGALLVGAYPAFVLSSFLPARVLKGLITQTGSGISIRRVLVASQFALSIILIGATFVVVRQFRYMQNENLGYQQEQLLVVKSPAIWDSTIAQRFSYFKSEIMTVPAVSNASITSDIPGHMIRFRNNVRRANEDKQHGFTSYLMEVDDKFIPTYHMEMVAGRNFNATDSSEISSKVLAKIVINEEVVKELGYDSPQSIVEKDIIFHLGQEDIKSRVIGVVRNFHQRSLKEKFDPILFYYPRLTGGFITLKMNVSDMSQSKSDIETVYKKAFPGNPFEYFFLDDFFNQQYQADARLAKVFGLFAALAIIVACTGLLGLSSFVIRLRTKEIGIRKVLGASVSGLLVLISSDFIKLVAIASVIALPVIYFAAKAWLDNYAFHIGLGWTIFVVPPLLLLLLTLATICFQSVKAAIANPVRSLKSE